MKKHQIPIFAEGRNANALHSSIMQGYTDIFKILLGKGADIEKVNTRYDHNISPLELSLTFFKKEISYILLKEYEDRKIPIFADGLNAKALNFCTQKGGGYIDIIRNLLGHHGVNVRSSGPRLNTELKLATFFGQKEAADLLATYHAISDTYFNEEEMGDYYRSKGEQEANVREYLTKLNLISRVSREEGLSVKQILNLEITAEDIKTAEENSRSTAAAIDSYIWPDPLSLEAIKSDARTEAEPRTEITKLAENLFRLKNNGIGIGFFNLVNKKLPADKKIENLKEIASVIEFLSEAIPPLPKSISSLTITNASEGQLQLICLASIVADFITNPERYIEKNEPPLAIVEESKEPAAEPPITKKDGSSLAVVEESKKTTAEPPIGRVAKLRTAIKKSREADPAEATSKPIAAKPEWLGVGDRPIHEERPSETYGSEILSRKPTRPTATRTNNDNRNGRGKS